MRCIIFHCKYHTLLKMGSGISLSHERQLENAYNEWDNGYEIHYDFSEEAALNKTIRELHLFLIRKNKKYDY